MKERFEKLPPLNNDGKFGGSCFLNFILKIAR